MQIFQLVKAVWHRMLMVYRQFFWRTSDWLRKAEQLYCRQQFDSAIAAYTAVLKRNPENYRAWYKQGYSLWEMHRYEEALRCVDRALQLQPDAFELWCDRARLLSRLQCIDAAIARYDSRLKR